MGEFLENLRAKIGADKEKSHENKERGKNTHVELIFTRHEEKDGDKITEQGLKNAQESGKKIALEEERPEYLMTRGSRGAQRARETGQAFTQGVQSIEEATEKMVELINKEGKKGKLAEFGVYALSDLDLSENIKKVVGPLWEEAKQKAEKGELDSTDPYTSAIDQWLKLPLEKFHEAGAETPQEIAARLAHQIKVGENMSGRLFADLDLAVDNFTHGPNPDAFMAEMGLVKNMAEIGGAFKTGESFEIDIKRDENGELVEPLILKFRGKEYQLDKAKLDELADLGKELQQQRLHERAEDNIAAIKGEETKKEE